MNLRVEDIRTLQNISPQLLDIWADACIILLDEVPHYSPTKFTISGQWNNVAQLEWIQLNNQNGYEDKQQTAEFAGYGMAVLILTTLEPSILPFGRVAKGEGVDLKFVKQDEPENFLNDVFVEVKCTRNKKSLDQMFRKGINQSKKKAERFPVYVIAVEFESPAAQTYLHP